MTNRIVFDLSTGIESSIPYTEEEEAAHQIKLLEIAAQEAQQPAIVPPTKEQLMAELAALTAKINAL